MHGISHPFTRKYTFYGRWMQIVTTVGRFVEVPRPRRVAQIDLLEARDHMLRDIGLLDGPDMALRRSELTLPSERHRP